MSTQQLTGENVNVRQRAERAATRTAASNGHRAFPSPVEQVEQEHDQPRGWRKFLPRWERLTMADKTIDKGFVVTPAMAVTLLIFWLGSVGGVYWRMSDKVDNLTNTITAQMAADKVEKEWARAEVRRVDNQNKINYELYRQVGETQKQILGYVQGQRGVKLQLETREPEAPPQ
jgi:hypothetical protein